MQSKPSFSRRAYSKFLSTCSITLSLGNGFLGCYGLLGLLAIGLSNPMMYGIAAGLGGFNAMLMYSGAHTAIKNLLGLKPAEVNPMLLMHRDEVDLTEKVNAHLLDITTARHIIPGDYKNLVELTRNFNRNIETQKKRYQDYPEKPGKKIIRYLITGLGAALSVGSGYSLATFLFGAFGLVLLSTPGGAIVAGVAMLMSLVMFSTLSRRNIFNFINPDFQLFSEVSNKLQSFDSEHAVHALSQSVTLHTRLCETPRQIHPQKKTFHTIHDWPIPHHTDNEQTLSTHRKFK